jgi:hypothetical protein
MSSFSSSNDVMFSVSVIMLFIHFFILRYPEEFCLLGQRESLLFNPDNRSDSSSKRLDNFYRTALHYILDGKNYS